MHHHGHVQAAKLYEQAFMENCDVLRETNSKRILYRTLEERNAQVNVTACNMMRCRRACMACPPQQLKLYP